MQDQRLIQTAEAYLFLEKLHERNLPQPHQMAVARALFIDGCKDIWVEGGRKGGKSYGVICYCAWRWAGMFPGSHIYYYAPEQKQAKEILWAPQIIQNFGPREYLTGKPNDTEMRVNFKNGSYIKLDGSDNFDSVRGISSAHLFFLDERRDFKKEFFPAFDPNRARFMAPVISTSTPPEAEGPYTEKLISHLDGMDIMEGGRLDQLKQKGGVHFIDA